MHATNGNRKRVPRAGPGGEHAAAAPSPGAWRTAPTRGADPRFLQEPQSAGRLQAAGWALPSGTNPEMQLRVYDTRLDPGWLQRNLRDLCPVAPGRVEFIGGDFLTEPRPLRDDIVALDAHRLRRWGPEEVEPYHLVVLPRPHQAAWLERGRQQVPFETAGSVISVLCIVSREHCPVHWDEEALRRALPGVASLLADQSLEVHVTAVGERPPLRRVPATTRQLPPSMWEIAHLALNRVLLVVSFARRVGPTSTPLGRWLGEPPPQPKPSALELLRVEYVLPPATRAQQAERALRVALRTTAKEMAVHAPAGPQLRQVQVEHGGVVALLEVPREEARTWLKGSGCGGLYLRPFWTKDTGRDVSRDNFQLWWLRGVAAEAAAIWQALRHVEGFMGLLPGGADIAVRVTTAADLTSMQQQVRFRLQREQLAFRVANPASRWWRLGPLTAAEVAVVRRTITDLGLSLERGEVRFAAANHTRTRSFAFFAATGNPSTLTLDNGTWTASEAKLVPADPPPRRPSTQARTGVRAALQPAPSTFVKPPRGGPALTPQSTWAGPQRTSPAAPHDANVSVPAAESTALPPRHLAAPAAQPGSKRVVPPADRQQRPSLSDSSGGVVETWPSRRRRRRHQSARQPTSADDMEELRTLLRELQAELRALRRENELLRRAQLTDPWRQQPPYFPVAPMDAATVHQSQLAPMRQEPVAPNSTRPATPPGDADMQPAGALGSHGRDPGDTPDGKRQPRVARALEVDDPHDV